MCNRELIPLIRQYQNKDQREFHKIYENFIYLLKHYSKKLDTDDTYQDLWLFLVNLLNQLKLDNFCEDESDGLQRYITVSIRNQFLALQKRKKKGGYVFIEDYADIAINDGIEETLNLKEALSMLPKRQAQIVILRFVYQYSDVDIARKLHIRRETVNRNKQRALTKLKEYYLPQTEKEDKDSDNREG